MNAPDATAAAMSFETAALFSPFTPALLALADGTVFRGRAIGALGSTTGEVVFNTAMTGYRKSPVRHMPGRSSRPSPHTATSASMPRTSRRNASLPRDS
jgi:hypothetical protein